MTTVKLIYNGKVLENNKTLEDYNISFGSTLHLLTTPSTIQIIVKQIGGRYLTFDINPSESIKTLKQKIHERLKIPLPHQRLIHKKLELPDEVQIKDSGLRNLSVVSLIFSIEASFRVKTVQNQLIIARLLSDRTIRDLKMKIQKLVNISAEKQIICCKGRKLDNSTILADVEEFKLFVFEEKNRQIHVELADKQIHTFHCDDETSIRWITKEIKKIEVGDGFLRKIVFAGDVIEDNSRKINEICDDKVINMKFVEANTSTCYGQTDIENSFLSEF
jgi:ubiquitin C